MNGGIRMNASKLGLLLELRDFYDFLLGQHATDYTHKASTPGHELYFNDIRQRLALTDELITEQKATQ